MTAEIIPFPQKQRPPVGHIEATMAQFVAGIQEIRQEERRQDQERTAAALASMPEHVRAWYLHGSKE